MKIYLAFVFDSLTGSSESVNLCIGMVGSNIKLAKDLEGLLAVADSDSERPPDPQVTLASEECETFIAARCLYHGKCLF